VTDTMKIFLVLLVVGGGIGFAGATDHTAARLMQAEAMERAYMEQQSIMESMRERNRIYAEAIVSCLNRRGFVLKDAAVLCEVIPVPQKKAPRFLL